MAIIDQQVSEISVDESRRSTCTVAGTIAMTRLVIGMTSRTGIRAEALAITNDLS